MRIPPQRFRDDGRSEASFLDDILVTCPRCAAAGTVRPIDAPPARPRGYFVSARRFVCSGCHHRLESHSGRFALGGACDPYLRLALRLQTRTRHGVIYAFNSAHLDWIAAFVVAPLRERRIACGNADRSVVSRLPVWASRQRIARRCCARSRGCAAG